MSVDVRPMLELWFGNFFEPFFSDVEAVREGLADTARLGFTTVNLDSKPWEDFFARYRGEPASKYVAMQEFIMSESAALGMDYTCLALYFCGDNLYPNIRDVPPVRGEDAIGINGESLGTYKYWSARARQTMVDHVKGLVRLYGQGMHRSADGRPVVQTMFDPMVKPSFDEEGRRHYISWLRQQYSYDLDALNRKYGLDAKSFDDLSPCEYWLRPEELSSASCAVPTKSDFSGETPDLFRWLDNQKYPSELTVEYFATMERSWLSEDTRVFSEPVLQQWGYFFNPPGRAVWQTGQRALDVYRIARHVDSALIIAAPLDAENRPNAYALSVETSIARCANGGRDFTGGLYLGRHVNEDIYAFVSPGEAIATEVAGGARRLHVYGYSGLDDGGVLWRMGSDFKQSIREANLWAQKVIPLIDAPRDKEVALLFPAEMSLFEPVEVDEDGRHRMDLLGWYKQLTDLGWQVDILHKDQVVSGALSEYRHLVIPANSMYRFSHDETLEAAVREFAESGRTVLHGPHDALVEAAFGIAGSDVPYDCISWEGQGVIPHGWSTVAYESADDEFGVYYGSGETAFACTHVGRGSVYSFGFEYGYAYSRRTMPAVPPQYGKQDIHPVVLFGRTPVEAILGAPESAPMPASRGVEMARFGRHVVIVNHRSTMVDLSEVQAEEQIEMVPSAPGWLPGHSAIYLLLGASGA